MDTTSVAYVLCRIEDDSSLTPVSRHGDFLTGIAAAGYAVEVEDFDFAYALYAGDPSNGSSTRVASFREGRIGYRLWATRTGRISPERRGPLRPRHRRAHGLTPHEYRISLAAQVPIAPGAAFALPLKCCAA
jgi:hypothetical protein